MSLRNFRDQHRIQELVFDLAGALTREYLKLGHCEAPDVDFWTSRDAREVLKSHVNYAVADTRRWEQSAAFYIDCSEHVAAFVKNAGLGFAIPYFHNGQMHDYIPDFLIRLHGAGTRYLILETKGYDPLAEVKKAAAERWVAAVNEDGK